MATTCCTPISPVCGQGRRSSGAITPPPHEANLTFAEMVVVLAEFVMHNAQHAIGTIRPFLDRATSQGQGAAGATTSPTVAS